MSSIHSFHSGRPLNLWERCSLRSFADHGHDITLFTYGALDVPPGVKLENAAEIISERERDNFFGLAPGSFAQFSDLFRYELLAHRGGWWVDTDVVCLSAEMPSGDPWVARRNDTSVNNAVLHFRAGHPLMRLAADEARARIDPRVRSPIGPSFLYALLVREKFSFPIQPLDPCYPIIGRSIFDIGEPSRRSEVAERVKGSCALHWWNSRFSGSQCPRNALPPEGSWLADRFEQHGGAGSDHYSVMTWRIFVATHDRVKREQNQLQKSRWQRLRKRLGRYSALWAGAR